MRRTIVIGNSHVGALKGAWERIRVSRPDDDVSFFAAPAGPCYRQLRLMSDLVFGLPANEDRTKTGGTKASEHCRNIVRRINGQDSVDLKSTDIAVLAGHRLPGEALAKLLAMIDIDGLRETGAKNRLSRPMFEIILDDMVRAALPSSEWLGWRAPRLVIALKPFPAASIVDAEPNSYWSTLQSNPEGVRTAFSLCLEKLNRHLEQLGIGMIAPPESALLPSGLTQPEYSRNSSRLRQGVPHPEDESAHMNAEYGVLWFDKFFRMLDGQDQPASVALCS